MLNQKKISIEKNKKINKKKLEKNNDYFFYKKLFPSVINFVNNRIDCKFTAKFQDLNLESLMDLACCFIVDNDFDDGDLEIKSLELVFDSFLENPVYIAQRIMSKKLCEKVISYYIDVILDIYEECRINYNNSRFEKNFFKYGSLDELI